MLLTWVPIEIGGGHALTLLLTVEHGRENHLRVVSDADGAGWRVMGAGYELLPSNSWAGSLYDRVGGDCTGAVPPG